MTMATGDRQEAAAEPEPSVDHDEQASLKDLSPYQRTVFISLSLMNFSLFTLIPLIAPLYPTLAQRRGVTPLEMGFVMGASWLVMFTAAPVFGIYISRIGARMLTLFGITTAGLAAIWFGTLEFITNRWAFLILSLIIRVVEGLGVCAFIVAAQTIAAGVMRAHIQIVMGVFLTIQGVAVILSPLIAGFLYAAGGFIVPFALMGTVAVASAPISWWILRNFEGGTKVEKVSIKPLLLDYRAVSLVIHVTVLTTAFKFIEYYSALYVKQQFDYGPTMMGIIISVACISFAVTAIVWAKLAKLVGGRMIMAIAAVLSITACFFLGPVPFLNIYPRNWLYIIMLCIFGMSLSGGLVPVIPVLLGIARSNKMPDNFSTYGLVSACYNSSYDIGCFLGPLIGGPLYNYIGFAWTAAVFACLLFMTGANILFQHFCEKNISIWCRKKGEARHLLDSEQSSSASSSEAERPQVYTIDEVRTYDSSGSDSSVVAKSKVKPLPLTLNNNNNNNLANIRPPIVTGSDTQKTANGS